MRGSVIPIPLWWHNAILTIFLTVARLNGESTITGLTFNRCYGLGMSRFVCEPVRTANRTETGPNRTESTIRFRYDWRAIRFRFGILLGYSESCLNWTELC